DDRHGVEQPCDDEHLDLQHVREFRLTRGALEELAAQDAEADGGPQAAEADHEACCDHGGAHELSDLGQVFHLLSPSVFGVLKGIESSVSRPQCPRTRWSTP